MSGTSTTPAPRVYRGPAVTEGGCLLTPIPFHLGAAPLELRVQADRTTGVFSGGFEVGLQVQPGPIAVRGRSVTELITLFASGDGVTFLPQSRSHLGSYQASLTADPPYWDLPTGLVYDLASVMTVVNRTPWDQTIYFSKNTNLLDTVSQTASAFSRSSVTVLSGKQEDVVLALRVTASVAAREDITVTGITDQGGFLDPAKVIVNVSPDAPPVSLYQVTNPSSYDWTVGSPVNVTLTTAGGGAGTAIWGVSDLEFLTDHGIRLASAGTLISNGTVRGPAASRGLVFWVRNQREGGGQDYAAKMIQVSIS